ncbi:uncharacterized protein LOC128042963 [Gossypium raimondii]|uniref:uncharacterized protein LOC128042963 n=1 Tax=Gossypium raimondii TaxID=29730 RepID=UPI00227B3F5D|nr:uncharacterized protein LOC128042963 [Gossypium raimondii]
MTSDVGVSSPQAHVFTQAQYQQILSLLNKEAIVEVAASLAGMIDVGQNWIMDTGATDHMLSDFQFLESPVVCASHSPCVRLTNDFSISITHVGTCTVQPDFQLTKDILRGNIKGICRERGGIYILEPSRQTSVAVILSVSSIRSIEKSFHWLHVPCPDDPSLVFMLSLKILSFHGNKKKQTTVSRSLAEAEYRSMAAVVAEIIWLDGLLKEVCLSQLDKSLLFSDSGVALQIAANLVFHECTKHIETDCHFVQDKIGEGLIQMQHIGTTEHLADLMTKALGIKQHEYLVSKLGVKDLFHPST